MSLQPNTTAKISQAFYQELNHIPKKQPDSLQSSDEYL